MYLLIGAVYQVSDEAHGSPFCFNFFLNLFSKNLFETCKINAEIQETFTSNL